MLELQVMQISHMNNNLHMQIMAQNQRQIIYNPVLNHGYGYFVQLPPQPTQPPYFNHLIPPSQPMNFHHATSLANQP